MKDYPIEKYRFIHTGNKVIALSTFAGRVVRGMAKCDPRDDFDPNIGERIAATRCALKIAKRRSTLAWKKYTEAKRAFNNGKQYLKAMQNYFDDADFAVVKIQSELDHLLGD